ncbi:MAG: acyltransferase [Chloroflexota bacterium]|nr:acyltransferase [Chloroflexota bacterium]
MIQPGAVPAGSVRWDVGTVEPLGYRPDLDGLRAVAVLLVIATHAHLPWTNNGGDAGVTAFFVLSGYLITRLLIEERERTGRTDLAGFYRRRAVRLGPALLLVLAFVALASSVVVWPGAWQAGVAACLIYVSNWVQVLGVQIDPLGHTWSLAIEEQFYFVWPALLLLLGRRRVLWLAVIGIVAGSLARTFSDGTFEYFSTATRGDAILLGCVLALAGVRLPAWAGGLGIAVLVGVAYLNLSHDLTIPISMLSAGLVVTSEWRSLGRLAAVGRRAYGLYLWNWPLAILFGPLGAVLTFVAAEASYRLVERPLMRRFSHARPRSPVAVGQAAFSQVLSGPPAPSVSATPPSPK